MSRFEQAHAISSARPQATGEVGAWLARQRARFARLGARWAARRKVARDLRQLDLCTDRELWDMGLSRSDFPAIIRGTYRRD
jgi:uncharacterized protein YjiS (DUF1127 family)